MKVTKSQAKLISKTIRRSNLEHSDYCVECLQETDISELNLATGICTTCKKTIKKLSKDEIKKLVSLYDN